MPNFGVFAENWGKEHSCPKENMKKFQKSCHSRGTPAYLQVVKLVARTEASSSALRFRAFMEGGKVRNSFISFPLALAQSDMV